MIAIATRYPNGITFTMGGEIGFPEIFYVYEGKGSRTYPDGEKVAMREGDFIFNSPGQQITYEYGPGFADVAIFWDTKPLPEELLGGLTVPDRPA